MIILSIIDEKNIILSKLTSVKFSKFISEFNVSSVMIFGSICNDEFNELSDVDIAILGKSKMSLDTILDIELFLEEFLERQIDVVDLKSDTLDFFVKMNILNNGKAIYSKDNNMLFNEFCEETDRIYRENENFMYFRRLDVLS
ncbi:TPA: type VII toxin-antitoxin system MntA family adenylyltransferase antitoxin [Clostridium botulinum]|uniref:type VII toxin-antitoxin system MntA family adenylyltransferase antitoxin n=1 Tax=Clostridium botulinum TaxID=1491 RepID=UPI00090B8D48|nr:nucleotidyltransferase domain-containing protein [Clostridium botulinum]APC78933.1 nucleotidyltransferase domain protein [Clostridium botulinum]APC84217.1 nucleotidyltransferase domain protein [Clostridium botulinum]MCS4438201.1 nucleotidyltransferase domain-containing protein [Clostridium botulinum]MCS4447707.1 nucleotidyltransferase domain-containing protein [Clostridium botulinum]MCS4458211.1 nucleotidyltransferase domain-containing protein [Clostridium botulinum]